MTDHHREIARHIVDRFRKSLTHEACEYITTAQFGDLEMAIHQALSHEHEHIADLLDALVRTLRTGVDKPDLAL